jgi:DNA-binding response OmpR family regulator
MVNILVVDDEPGVTFILNEILTRKGFNVEAANNGSDALKKVKAHKPELVLLDVMMPDLAYHKIRI